MQIPTLEQCDKKIQCLKEIAEGIEKFNVSVEKVLQILLSERKPWIISSEMTSDEKNWEAYCQKLGGSLMEVKNEGKP